MTTRLRHYHLGCGESLFTHYDRLWDASLQLKDMEKKEKVQQQKNTQKKVQVKD